IRRPDAAIRRIVRGDADAFRLSGAVRPAQRRRRADAFRAGFATSAAGRNGADLAARHAPGAVLGLARLQRNRGPADDHRRPAGAVRSRAAYLSEPEATAGGCFRLAPGRL